ncbi:TetR/AcrR family transcriptional regulator [Gracilibacillus sp. S3-1-1]|uniref:TetR/AcrR family transcriptional regulator n=1 Tax=Gracilibacillus pellucidus TaxID=3095368 RepID=A0ACC6M857_9BACI|nr:TetR/AcrR family transcriptional regulator [Gracilibacillus sp. S3-1-1]MDX8047078.1 TetR/AcrR family transcriptional regulator [Gracilibacillus sp. S3-1-1]
MIPINKKELTSIQILEAALRLFKNYGIEKTSLAMIAKEVGITKPSIYYHFSSKEELIEHSFNHILRNYKFSDFFHVNELNKENFGEKLYQFGLDFLPTTEDDNYELIKVLNEFTLLSNRNNNFKQRLVSVQFEFINGFRNILLKGIDEGVIKVSNVDNYAQLLALVIDNIARSIMIGFNIDYKEVWKETVNSLLKEEEKI